MTMSEWKRKRRLLLTGEPVAWQEGHNKYEINVFDGYYGKQYSLRSLDTGNTIECTYDLNKICNIVVY